MGSVKLSRVGNRLEELSYPISREEAAEQLEGVTLLLADGQTDLGKQITQTRSETFETSEDLVADLYGVLPIEAVGEPHQSEGEG